MRTTDSSIIRKLSNSRKPYVYWAAPKETPIVEQAAAELTFGIWRVDARAMTDAPAVFHIFGEKFRFEDNFGPRWGRNWDALIDGLRELNRTSFKGYILFVDHSDDLWLKNPPLYYKFMDVICSVAEYWDEWKDAQISFKTVLVAESDELRRVVAHHLD